MTHHNRNLVPPTVEFLESRKLFCGSATASAAIASLADTRAVTVAPKILGPSAVEGTYHGDASIDDAGSTTTLQIKIIITPTSITLYATGYGKKTVALTTKEFNAIRKGTFNLSTTIDHEPLSFTGAITDSGDRIAGSFSAGSGSSAITGSFVLKKLLPTT
jgi:hypothetical protein